MTPNEQLKAAVKSRSKNNKFEEQIQIAFSNYIKLQYPDVIFSSESSGIRLTMGQAMKAKRQRSEDKLPDMNIAEARGGYCGLYFELKEPDNSPFMKDGKTLKRKFNKKTGLDSIAEQACTLDRLKAKGYFAQFVIGLDEAIRIFDWYMKLEPTPLLWKRLNSSSTGS